MNKNSGILDENISSNMMEAIEDREPEECPYPGCGAMLPRDVSFQELHMFRCHPVGMAGGE